MGSNFGGRGIPGDNVGMASVWLHCSREGGWSLWEEEVNVLATRMLAESLERTAEGPEPGIHSIRCAWPLLFCFGVFVFFKIFVYFYFVCECLPAYIYIYVYHVCTMCTVCVHNVCAPCVCTLCVRTMYVPCVCTMCVYYVYAHVCVLCVCTMYVHDVCALCLHYVCALCIPCMCTVCTMCVPCMCALCVCTMYVLVAGIKQNIRSLKLELQVVVGHHVGARNWRLFL